jgi:endoglucanase
MYVIKRISITLMLSLTLIVACSPRTVQTIPSPTAVAGMESSPTPSAVAPTMLPDQPTAFDTIAAMKRGINIGNALEAPNEGEGGVVIQEDYFDIIKGAGFSTVRIPIRWSAHAAEVSPYTIEPAFFARIDEVVQWALARDLIVVINIHNYSAMVTDPNGQRERYLALWMQIAEHYKDYPPTLLFELLNEPSRELSAPLWNEICNQALAVVRKSNLTRNVIIGPVYWNNYAWMSTLDLPVNDINIIATFHYYQPFQFTHQGADWEKDSSSWLGTSWNGTEAEKQIITGVLDSVDTWAQEHNRPILLGEFGTYYKADMDSRVRWAEFITREAEARGFAWTYWEFCSGFGIYDRDAQQFLEPLLRALIP